MSVDVDRLASIAQQLAGRVRDDDPAANQRWLHAMLPDPAEREALCYVLAAAVPDDRPFSYLVAWTGGLEPCGTNAAAVRHRRHGEPLDDECLAAERARNAKLYRRRRGPLARETSPVKHRESGAA